MAMQKLWLSMMFWTLVEYQPIESDICEPIAQSFIVRSWLLHRQCNSLGTWGFWTLDCFRFVTSICAILLAHLFVALSVSRWLRGIRSNPDSFQWRSAQERYSIYPRTHFSNIRDHSDYVKRSPPVARELGLLPSQKPLVVNGRVSRYLFLTILFIIFYFTSSLVQSMFLLNARSVPWTFNHLSLRSVLNQFWQLCRMFYPDLFNNKYVMAKAIRISTSIIASGPNSSGHLLLYVLAFGLAYGVVSSLLASWWAVKIFFITDVCLTGIHFHMAEKYNF